MKRRTLLGGIGTVATAIASAGCYMLADGGNNSSGGDGGSSNDPSQNGNQGGSNTNQSGSGDQPSSGEPAQSGDSNQSQESGESDTSPKAPDENETADYSMREEQKARQADDVPESHINISVTEKNQTDTGIQIKGKVKNMTSVPITFVDVDITFEDSRGSYLHSELCTVRTIEANGSEEFDVTAYYQQIPGEVGNITISIADSGRVPEQQVN